MSSNVNETYKSIPKEKFEFVQKGERLTDVKLQTKPMGFFADAMSRFVKNRGSVICFGIIVILVLYALLAPIFSPYDISTRDGYYSYVTPRNNLFAGSGFWDGTQTREVNLQTYQYFKNIPGAIAKDYGTVTRYVAKRPQTWYKISLDTYAKVGWVKMLLTKEEYDAAKAYEKETGIQLFYPVIDTNKIVNDGYKRDSNAYFLTDQKGVVQYDKQGNIIPIYVEDTTSPDGYAYYFSRMNGNQLETRVLYKEWYMYKNGHYASFLFGTDISGYDIFTRLAHGARFSLVIAIVVSAINLLLGTIVGAFEGYYGGRVDLIVERIKDVLYDVPSFIIFALFQLYLANYVGPTVSLFFAFIFYGWISTSSTVRAQFYRFKGQDYVNASRTLGAKDTRLIFRHILPNAIGFIITASVLSIPGTIYTESNLTYLGIVNLEGDSLTSVGTMLNNANAALSVYPHALFFPAAFIGILLVCFNEFGNGLRDAFNPSLRGAENA